MKLDTKKYWLGGHKKYAVLPWIDKPSIFAKEVVKHFPFMGRLLDLGAGQGQDSRYFAKKGYGVISTDFSQLALKLSQEKAEKEGLKFKIQELDVSEKFPFQDNSFDIVYSHLALHYWDREDTRGIFDEISRVLRPGGILAALFNSENDPEIKDFEKVGGNLYLDPKGLVKSYWTADYLREFIGGSFEFILLDDKGRTYKDSIRTLVRFVGKNIKLSP